VHRYRRVQGKPARSKTPCAWASTLRGNRELPGSPQAVVTLGRFVFAVPTPKTYFISSIRSSLVRRICTRSMGVAKAVCPGKLPVPFQHPYIILSSTSPRLECMETFTVCGASQACDDFRSPEAQKVYA
jgi:hypothetical protein